MENHIFYSFPNEPASISSAIDIIPNNWMHMGGGLSVPEKLRNNNDVADNTELYLGYGEYGIHGIGTIKRNAISERGMVERSSENGRNDADMLGILNGKMFYHIDIGVERTYKIPGLENEKEIIKRYATRGMEGYIEASRLREWGHNGYRIESERIILSFDGKAENEIMLGYQKESDIEKLDKQIIELGFVRKSDSLI